MAGLLTTNWKYLFAALAAPPLVILLGSRLKAQTPTANPYRNLRAFLITIQYAEGTYGPDAYKMLYGGSLFSGYGSHPNRHITKSGITSTAAGAYQIMFSTWQTVARSIGLDDFSPLNQDRAAIELIRRRGALEDVFNGRLEAAIEKCRKEWASFPGAGYGQGERSITALATIYQRAGGSSAA